MILYGVNMLPSIMIFKVIITTNKHNSEKPKNILVNLKKEK